MRFGNNFVRHIPHLLRTYGFQMLIGAVILAGACYAAFNALMPGTSALHPSAAQGSTSTVGGLGVKEARQVRQQLDEQREDAKIREDFPKLQKTLEGMTAKLTQTEEARKGEVTDLKGQIASLQQQLHAQRTTPASVRQPATPPAPKPPVVKSPPVPPPPPSLPTLGSRLYLLSPSEKPGHAVKPPRANNLQTAHIPAWSFAPVRLLFGGQASSRERSASPILFAVVGEFTGPYQLQGPGRNPLRTALEIQGCFAGGAAGGDLAVSRVLAQPATLSCVFPSGESFEHPVKATIYGVDGRVGLPAKVDYHASSAEMRAFLTAMLQEASAAFGLAKSKVVVTSVTGAPQPFQGMQSQLDRLGQFYVQQMQYLTPTLNADPGMQGWIVLEEGVTLDGLPTQTLVRGGQWPTY